MAINLLPEEEKAKIKPDKQEAVTHIEMTGPVNAEKKKRTAKKSGVLMFVKRAFRQPKQEAVEMKFPDPARHKGDVLSSQSQHKAIQPRVKVTRPKQEPMRVKSSKTLIQRFVHWVTHIFSGSSRVKPVTKEKYITPDAEKTFPKYKPVRAEKQSTRENGKSRQVEVIKVTTKYSQKEVGPRKSFWQPQPKVKVEPIVIEERGVPEPISVPHPKDEKKDLPEIELVPPKQKPVKPKEIIDKPKVHKPRFSLSKWWNDFVNSLKKLLSRKKKDKKEVVPEPPKADPHIPLSAKPGKPLEEIKLVPPKQKQVKPKEIIEKPKVHKSRFSLSKWWKNFINSLKKLLSKKKKEKKETVPEPAKVGPHILPPPKPDKPLEKIELVSSHDRPAKEKEKDAAVAIPVPPPPASIETDKKSASGGDEPQIEEVSSQKDEVPVPIPPKPAKPLEKIEIVPPQPPASPKDGIELTEPENGQFAKPGIEWEVNLIPDDALEVKVSFSKILILISFVILSIGLVFGGWITANWFYSNVTAEISKINRDISVAEANISSFQDLVDRVKLLKSDIDEVNILLDEHVYWDGIFQKLEGYTIPEVYYTSMTADVNGYLSFTAVGKDYDSAIKQLFVFEKASDFIINVSIESVNFLVPEEAVGPENVEPDNTERLVSFTIKMAVNPSIFYYPR